MPDGRCSQIPSSHPAAWKAFPHLPLFVPDSDYSDKAWRREIIGACKFNPHDERHKFARQKPVSRKPSQWYNGLVGAPATSTDL